MKKSTLDLPGLLASLDPDAGLAQRHLWLIHLAEWIRAAEPSVEGAVQRVKQIVEAFEADPEALAQALKKLLENPELAQNLGRAARDHALNHYGREHMWQQYQELLRS